MLNLMEYQRKLTEACERYEKTAPTVAAHCDDLFIRMNEAAQSMTLVARGVGEVAKQAHVVNPP
jgi:hypothetical protein